jgi:tripartite-type tricarboxylate transporter receptor subunit TctC
LVVSSATRAPDLPDVPTPAEAGAPGGDSSTWFAMFVPSKTPPDIIEKWHAAGVKVLASADMQASLTKLGIGPMPMKPAEIDALVAKEIAANMVLLKGIQ